MHRRHVLIVIAAVAGACSGSPGEPGRVVAGGPFGVAPSVVAALRVTTAADRASIRPGDSVRVRVVARNVGRDVIQIVGEEVGCPLTLEVRGPGPVNYYRGARFCGVTPMSPTIDLAPGDSLVGAAVWPGVTYVSTSGSVAGTEGPAPVGTYFAVGYLWLGRRSWVYGDSARVVVSAR